MTRQRAEISSRMKQAQRHVEQTPGPLNQYLQLWLKSVDLSDRTLAQYTGYIRNLAKMYPDVEPRNFTILQLTTFVAEGYGDYSSATQRIANQALKNFFGWLTNLDVMEESPAKRLRSPKRKPSEPRYLTPDEITAMMRAALNKGDMASTIIVALGAYAGLRRRSISRLTWADVDLTEGTLTARLDKGGKSRQLPIAPPLKDLLQTWKEITKDNESGHVVVKKVGGHWKPMSPHRIWARVKRYGRLALDKDIATHDLRRTFATTLSSNRVPLHTISRLLGHSSVTTTVNCYAFTTDDEKRAAIDTLRF